MDAINDIIEKVCAYLKKIFDAGGRGCGGPKRAQNSTFSKKRQFLEKSKNIPFTQ